MGDAQTAEKSKLAQNDTDIHNRRDAQAQAQRTSRDIEPAETDNGDINRDRV